MALLVITPDPAIRCRRRRGRRKLGDSRRWIGRSIADGGAGGTANASSQTATSGGNGSSATNAGGSAVAITAGQVIQISVGGGGGGSRAVASSGTVAAGAAGPVIMVVVAGGDLEHLCRWHCWRSRRWNDQWAGAGGTASGGAYSTGLA